MDSSSKGQEPHQPVVSDMTTPQPQTRLSGSREAVSFLSAVTVEGDCYNGLAKACESCDADMRFLMADGTVV